eukprot:SAG25_NODE_1636_length_2642_cov_19.232397_2_plen_27_part_01
MPTRISSGSVPAQQWRVDHSDETPLLQ